MALSKATTLSNGVTASYWRISSVLLDRKTCDVSFTMSLFLDSTQSQPIDRSSDLFCKIRFTKDETLQDIVALGYVKIKALIVAMDAIDSSDRPSASICSELLALDGATDA